MTIADELSTCMRYSSASPQRITNPFCRSTVPSSKVTRDILAVGDVWSYGTSPLELQNAETKRVASDVGATNVTFNSTRENATIMSVSTFTHLCCQLSICAAVRVTRVSQTLAGRSACSVAREAVA